LNPASDFTRALARAECLATRNIAAEVAFPARGENLLGAFPRFEDFDFAAQDNGQFEIALPCLKVNSAAQRTPLPVAPDASCEPSQSNAGIPINCSPLLVRHKSAR
jgi:hypothetical protein